MSNRNARVIEEFRLNGGPAGEFAGEPLLLLTTRGRSTGEERTNPLMYLDDAEHDRLLVFASKRGAPVDPDWYRNLVSDPNVTVEIGADKYQARAEVLTGAERDTWFAEQVRRDPDFGESERRTSRVIPVVALTRV